MLETILLANYLLFILYYLRNYLDVSKSFNLLLNSENNNYAISNFFKLDINIQSAENWKGFSETICQLFNSIYYINVFTLQSQACITRNVNIITKKSNVFSRHKAIKFNTQIRTFSNKALDDKEYFFPWLAGIIDGCGVFDIRKDPNEGNLYLNSLKITINNRDIRILTRIQNNLHAGIIRSGKTTSTYSISDKNELYSLLLSLNGMIRIKIDNFKKCSNLFNLNVIEPNYNIPKNNSYFAGLIDSIGLIRFNYSSNRIECILDLKYNNVTSKLCLDNVIPNLKPYTLKKRNNNSTHMIFKYQSVKGMSLLYDYFMTNRLYSDYKFNRISKIQSFIPIRNYQHEEFNSLEFKIYSKFVFNWVKYKNPKWTKTPFVCKLNMDFNEGSK